MLISHSRPESRSSAANTYFSQIELRTFQGRSAYGIRSIRVHSITGRMGNKILVVEDDNIPIIVISGKPPSEIADRAFRLGASAFLSKPVDRDKLVAAVRDAFGESVSET